MPSPVFLDLGCSSESPRGQLKIQIHGLGPSLLDHSPGAGLSNLCFPTPPDASGDEPSLGNITLCFAVGNWKRVSRAGMVRECREEGTERDHL